MAKDFAAELKKNREEKLNANKKKEKKEKKKGRKKRKVKKNEENEKYLVDALKEWN